MTGSLTRKTGLALLIVALAQTAALGWMVFDRVQLLRNGRELLLPVIPVDPRSLFRGDYARLGYAISTVPLADLRKERLERGSTLYVTIEQQPDGHWKALSGALTHPGKVGESQAVLKSRIDWVSQSGARTELGVRYGIERYYVPEGKGLELEKLVGQKKIAAIVAVDARGNAAIKGLAIEGKRIYDEPLF